MAAASRPPFSGRLVVWTDEYSTLFNLLFRSGVSRVPRRPRWPPRSAGAGRCSRCPPRPARATEEYAACTGRPCAHCHQSPAGGGELTARGVSFGQAVAADDGAAPPAALRRYGRAAVLFVHIVTAFFWFGTILYVHLILKPAYAAHGCRAAELRLGWAGIASIAVTGTILTLLRVDSWHDAVPHPFRRAALREDRAVSRHGYHGAAGHLGHRAAPREAPCPQAPPRPRRVHPGGSLSSSTAARGGRPLSGAAERSTISRRAGCGPEARTSAATPRGTTRRRRSPRRRTARRNSRRSRSSARSSRPPATTAHPHERGFFFMAYLNLGIVRR